MNDSSHYNTLNPIWDKETKAKGKLIYSTVLNHNQVAFNIIIDLTLVGNAITELKWNILGEHDLRPSDIVDQITEIVRNDDNSLTWEL
jgi:hypothetical protein